MRTRMCSAGRCAQSAVDVVSVGKGEVLSELWRAGEETKSA
jgi:hypothetical protein